MTINGWDVTWNIYRGRRDSHLQPRVRYRKEPKKKVLLARRLKSFLFLSVANRPCCWAYNGRKRRTHKETRYLLCHTEFIFYFFFIFQPRDDDGPDRLENRSFLFRPFAPPISCPILYRDGEIKKKKRNRGDRWTIVFYYFRTDPSRFI